MTIAELIHGAYRAKTQEQQERRLAFIERLASDVSVHCPFIGMNFGYHTQLPDAKGSGEVKPSTTRL